MSFQKITLQGSPYEIGLQHGQQAGEKVDRCIELYQNAFANVGISWEEAVGRAAQYVPVIEAYDPDLLAEMQGIADARKRTLIDIVTLNARSEVLFSAQAIDGCTTIAVPPPKSDGGTYIAQNWDHYSPFKDIMVFAEIRQHDKPNILMVTEAGIIGKIGMNDAGIGLCFNALGAEGTPGGLPVHCAIRGILNSRFLGEAIGAAIQTKSANAVNFQIASKEGVSVDIELSNDGRDVMFNHEGILVHTNHFVSPVLLASVKDRFQERTPDSHLRLGVTQRELRRIETPLNPAHIQAVLKNHMNYPDAVCRHGEISGVPAGKRGNLFDTIFSVVIDLSGGVMHVAAGQPCTTPYVAHSFEA